MFKLLKKIESGFKTFCILIFGLSILLLSAIIFLREGFGISYDYFVDLVIWLVIWSTVLLFGPLHGEGEHIAIGFLLRKLSGKLRVGVELFNGLCSLVLITIVTISGFEAVMIYYSQQQSYARFISIPMWIVHACMPIGFGIFTVYIIVGLWRIIRDFKNNRKHLVTGSELQEEGFQ